MTLSTTLLASDLTAMFADFVQTFTFQGASYSCAATDLSLSHDLMEEGFDGTADLALIIKTSDFTTLPALDQKITYRSNQYRISKITDCQDGISKTLFCVGLTK